MVRKRPTMGSSASIRNLLHLHIGHIIAESPLPLAAFNRLPNRGAHEFLVYPHASDRSEVRVDAGKKRRLPVELLACRDGDRVERVCDGEHVEVEARRGDLERGALSVQTCVRVCDVRVVRVRGAQVERREVRGTDRRRSWCGVCSKGSS